MDFLPRTFKTQPIVTGLGLQFSVKRVFLMKQIVAIVKPFLAEKVITSIGQFDVLELSVREVKGFGRQKN